MLSIFLLCLVVCCPIVFVVVFDRFLCVRLSPHVSTEFDSTPLSSFLFLTHSLTPLTHFTPILVPAIPPPTMSEELFARVWMIEKERFPFIDVRHTHATHGAERQPNRRRRRDSQRVWVRRLYVCMCVCVRCFMLCMLLVTSTPPQRHRVNNAQTEHGEKKRACVCEREQTRTDTNEYKLALCVCVCVHMCTHVC